MENIVLQQLEGIDWRRAWIERNNKRRTPDNSAYWDERALEFMQHSTASEYADSFIALLDPAPRQSILDMGCGTGTLAIPLAKAGHAVTACDFSAGMRAGLAERAHLEGITSLRIANLSWEDDWPAAGIAHKSMDIALASRSIIVNDLYQALLKLDRAAQKRAAVTIATEYGPRGYHPLGSAVDGLECFIPEYIYCMGVLWQMGARPELRYIESIRPAEAAAHLKTGDILIRWAFISWQPVTA